ncbi:Methionine aminopeptidase [uncultured archaeon]|nr:Methionine aminopeptidase [uncultured archaeon]
MEQEEIEKYVEAGRIAAEALKHGVSRVKTGETLLSVAQEVETLILKSGAGIAFPVNISLNEAAAHDTPAADDERIFTENDVVKVDVGVHVDGYIGDTAATIDLSQKHGRMIEANKRALDGELAMLSAGLNVSELGALVQKTLADAGFRPIENLTGHEVRQYDLHAGIAIPNIPLNSKTTIHPGTAVAIEPFATNGAGRVVESRRVEIFSLQNDRPVRPKDARLLLDAVYERGSLPFAARWFADLLPELRLNQALLHLMQQGVIRGYPVLSDKSKGVVTQFEHTSVILPDKVIVTTRL